MSPAVVVRMSSSWPLTLRTVNVIVCGEGGEAASGSKLYVNVVSGSWAKDVAEDPNFPVAVSVMVSVTAGPDLAPTPSSRQPLNTPTRKTAHG